MSNTDFNFTIGNWKVKNRKLINRLSDSQEWIEFDADYKSWNVLNNLANMDEFRLEDENNKFYGLSFRIYDPQKEEWKIYWADSEHLEDGIKFQVKGKFENKVGTFYGEEYYNGAKVQLRFIWKELSATQAYWEQAYLNEDKNEWETNWTMNFTKKV